MNNNCKGEDLISAFWITQLSSVWVHLGQSCFEHTVVARQQESNIERSYLHFKGHYQISEEGMKREDGKPFCYVIARPVTARIT